MMIVIISYMYYFEEVQYASYYYWLSLLLGMKQVSEGGVMVNPALPLTHTCNVRKEKVRGGGAAKEQHLVSPNGTDSRHATRKNWIVPIKNHNNIDAMAVRDKTTNNLYNYNKHFITITCWIRFPKIYV